MTNKAKRIVVFSPQGGCGKSVLSKALAKFGLPLYSVDQLYEDRIPDPDSITGDAIVDCPPYLNKIVQSHMNHSDLVIVPLTCQFMEREKSAIELANTLSQIVANARKKIIVLRIDNNGRFRQIIFDNFTKFTGALEKLQIFSEIIQMKAGIISAESTNHLKAILE